MATAKVSPISMVSIPMSSHSRSIRAMASMSALSQLAPRAQMLSYSNPLVTYLPVLVLVHVGAVHHATGHAGVSSCLPPRSSQFLLRRLAGDGLGLVESAVVEVVRGQAAGLVDDVDQDGGTESRQAAAGDRVGSSDHRPGSCRALSKRSASTTAGRSVPASSTTMALRPRATHDRAAAAPPGSAAPDDHPGRSGHRRVAVSQLARRVRTHAGHLVTVRARSASTQA